jgi:hypothetical protein
MHTHLELLVPGQHRGERRRRAVTQAVVAELDGMQRHACGGKPGRQAAAAALADAVLRETEVPQATGTAGAAQRLHQDCNAGAAQPVGLQLQQLQRWSASKLELQPLAVSGLQRCAQIEGIVGVSVCHVCCVS